MSRLNVIQTQVQRLLHIGSLTIIWFSTHLHTELRISSIPCTNLILGCILKIYKLKILAHTNVSRKIRLEKRREASCYTVSILSIILNSYGKISYSVKDNCYWTQLIYLYCFSELEKATEAPTWNSEDNNPSGKSCLQI